MHRRRVSDQHSCKFCPFAVNLLSCDCPICLLVRIAPRNYATSSSTAYHVWLTLRKLIDRLSMGLVMIIPVFPNVEPIDFENPAP